MENFFLLNCNTLVRGCWACWGLTAPGKEPTGSDLGRKPTGREPGPWGSFIYFLFYFIFNIFFDQPPPSTGLQFLEAGAGWASGWILFFFFFLIFFFNIYIFFLTKAWTSIAWGLKARLAWAWFGKVLLSDWCFWAEGMHVIKLWLWDKGAPEVARMINGFKQCCPLINWKFWPWGKLTD
jgi:hypothetical protein